MYFFLIDVDKEIGRMMIIKVLNTFKTYDKKLARMYKIFRGS